MPSAARSRARSSGTRPTGPRTSSMRGPAERTCTSRSARARELLAVVPLVREGESFTLSGAPCWAPAIRADLPEPRALEVARTAFEHIDTLAAPPATRAAFQLSPLAHRQRDHLRRRDPCGLPGHQPDEPDPRSDRRPRPAAPGHVQGPPRRDEEGRRAVRGGGAHLTRGAAPLPRAARGRRGRRHASRRDLRSLGRLGTTRRGHRGAHRGRRVVRHRAWRARLLPGRGDGPRTQPRTDRPRAAVGRDRVADRPRRHDLRARDRAIRAAAARRAGREGAQHQPLQARVRGRHAARPRL